MKYILVFVLSISLVHPCYSQNSYSEKLEEHILKLGKRIDALEHELKITKDDLRKVRKSIPELKQNIDTLSTQVFQTGVVIDNTKNHLTAEIENKGIESDKKINSVGSSLSIRTLYVIFSFFLVVIIGGILFYLLKKKLRKDKSAIDDQIAKNRKSIDEEQVLINTKLAEVYNGQMELLKAERQSKQTSSAATDHSLPLKVADEIVKMQMNLNYMDKTVRGHKNLMIAVTNVIDNFKANGYEIIDHFNKPFNEGMNMEAIKEPDSSLEANVQIIKRIIKPEVHFNNKLIQRAQVIVAYGE